MPEITLESLAARVVALEAQLAEQRATSPMTKYDWRQLVGTMEDNEFTRSMIAEMEAAREAERTEARAARAEDPAA